MEELAFKIAQELLNSGERSYTRTFTINGRPGDEIVVYVILDNEQRITVLGEMMKAIPIASGNPCPRCNGTGRI